MKVDSYRRLDWTGQGTYHRFGLFREQESARDLSVEPGRREEIERDETRRHILKHLSLEAHAITMSFHSDNIFNTETNAIRESQYAQFVGTSLAVNINPFRLVTGFDQSWFWFAKQSDNDFYVSTVRQGLVYERFLGNNVAITLQPSWQYSLLHNRRTDDRILEQWTYGLNNELAWFPVGWLIGTFSYNFSFLDATAPRTASDKYKHDFNLGATLVPIKDVRLFVSPSVQFSFEDFQRSNRQDRAWTPTLALTFQPLSFLALDAVGSYTDSRSNADGRDFQVWAGTLFLRLFYRL